MKTLLLVPLLPAPLHLSARASDKCDCPADLPRRTPGSRLPVDLFMKVCLRLLSSDL